MTNSLRRVVKLFCFFLLLLLPVLAYGFDPYQVLGVSKSATKEQIRKAFKKLAIKWHPDKNPSPAAQSRFLELNEAHEILSDPARKRDWDEYGARNDQEKRQKQQQREQQRYSHYRFHYDHNYQQRYNTYINGQDGPSGTIRITVNNWENFIFHSSDDLALTQTKTNEALLIFVYSTNSCELCRDMSPILEKLSLRLRKYNSVIRTGRINAEFDYHLVRKYNIKTVPQVLLFTYSLEGHIKQVFLPSLHHSHVTQATTPNVLELEAFISQHMFEQDSFIPVLTEGIGKLSKAAGAEKLRKQFEEFRRRSPNLPHVYVISKQPTPSLFFRYIASYLRDRMVFAHICLPCISYYSSHLSSLTSLMDNVALPSSVSHGSYLYFQREEGTPFEFLDKAIQDVDEDDEEDNENSKNNKVAEILQALKPYQFLHIPKLTSDNFYDLCYPLTRKASGSPHHQTKKESVHCLIYFAKSAEQAKTALLPLLFPTNFPPHHSTQTSFSVPSAVRFGWVDITEQRSFYNYFLSTSQHHMRSHPTSSLVAVMLEDGYRHIPYLSSTPIPSTEVLSKFVSQAYSNAKSKAWLDGKSYGGMPYLMEEPKPINWLNLFIAPFKSIFQVLFGASSSESFTMIFGMLFTLLFFLLSSSMVRFVD